MVVRPGRCGPPDVRVEYLSISKCHRPMTVTLVTAGPDRGRCRVSRCWHARIWVRMDGVIDVFDDELAQHGSPTPPSASLAPDSDPWVQRAWLSVREWMSRWPLFGSITLWVGLAVVAFAVLSRLWTGRWFLGRLTGAPIDAASTIFAALAGVAAVGYLVIKFRERAGAECAEHREVEGIADQKLMEAVAQLGDAAPTVRIAGVYALADVADRYGDAYRQRVVDILCGYLRTDRLVRDEHGALRYQLGDDGRPDTGRPVSRDGAVESTILATIANHLRLPDPDSSTDGQLRGDQLWCGCHVDLHATHFTEQVDFTGARFDQDVTFAGATFSGNAWFDMASFAGRAVFARVLFRGDAGFEHATFDQDAMFAGAAFTHTAGFAHVTFSGAAGFNHATFRQAAGFYHATFAGDALFDGVLVCRDAMFAGATFRQATTFDRDLQANRDTVFGGTTSFEHAAFKQAVGFSHATFDASALFAWAEFDQDAWFTDAKFSGDTKFNAARIRGDARFERTTFSGNAEFDYARFDKNAWFTRARFDGEVGFDGVMFNRPAPGMSMASSWFPASLKEPGQDLPPGARWVTDLPAPAPDSD